MGGLLIIALTTAGCGSSLDLAPVKGQVMCLDKPVPGGTITFTPIPKEGESQSPGPPAMGTVDENGNFELFTLGKPGALIGPHRVGFLVPEVEKSKEEAASSGSSEEAAEASAEKKAEQELAAKLAKVPCRRPDMKEVTVAAGDNTFTVELTRNNED